MTLSEKIGPLALGTAAVLCGSLFLIDVGALPGMATRNIAAYGLGLVLGWVGHRFAHVRWGAAILFSAATLVLGAVLAVGIELDGVRRWLALGPVNLQPALVLCPLLLAIAGSREGRHWRVAILLPLVLVAAQPDAASAVALAVGVAAMMASASNRARKGWSRRRIATAIGAVALAVVGLVAWGIQTPPPVAFVEGTAGIAALSGGIAALLHFLAVALAVVALLVRHDPAGAALAGYVATAAVAAIFWAFPMPIAGAGPSHLIGFGIAIGWLATRDRLARRGRAA